MASPTHQFEIKPLIPLEIAGVDISFTNSSLWMMIALGVSICLMSLATRKMAMVPGRMQAFGEGMYDFIDGMIRDNLGEHGKQYFTLIFTLFFIVFFGNALGLVPYSFTYTSHLAVTAALAFLVFFMVIGLGIARHGLHFFSIFLPPGVPAWLVPLVFLLELISFLIRPVTLSVRLFANMVAGHIMMKVFAGFSVGLLSLGALGFGLGLLPMGMNIVMIGFELLIAYLQAYVFTVLCCIYLKDTLDLHH
ncbi:MAG: F0F1 ATP synthase subunit A [Alphaproteobacteria bacterium]|nr:F0F1 ATP synthase subunit A [Alphaproteobacteria bacterium]